jgi:hypothetical protein
MILGYDDTIPGFNILIAKRAAAVDIRVGQLAIFRNHHGKIIKLNKLGIKVSVVNFKRFYLIIAMIKFMDSHYIIGKSGEHDQSATDNLQGDEI